jgi:hypothetical protein
MSGAAVTLMLVSLVLVWGGFAAVVIFAALRSRGRLPMAGRDT